VKVVNTAACLDNMACTVLRLCQNVMSSEKDWTPEVWVILYLKP